MVSLEGDHKKEIVTTGSLESGQHKERFFLTGKPCRTEGRLDEGDNAVSRRRLEKSGRAGPHF